MINKRKIDNNLIEIEAIENISNEIDNGKPEGKTPIKIDNRIIDNKESINSIIKQAKECDVSEMKLEVSVTHKVKVRLGVQVQQVNCGIDVEVDHEGYLNFINKF